METRNNKKHIKGDGFSDQLQEDLIAGRCVHDDIDQTTKQRINQLLSELLLKIEKTNFVVDTVLVRKFNKYYRVNHTFLYAELQKYIKKCILRK